MGTLMGALIIGLISNALNLMDVSSYYQLIVKAVVILIAVLFDFKLTRRKLYLYYVAMFSKQLKVSLPNEEKHT